jgi:hypothetical protein
MKKRTKSIFLMTIVVLACSSVQKSGAMLSGLGKLEGKKLQAVNTSIKVTDKGGKMTATTRETFRSPAENITYNVKTETVTCRNSEGTPISKKRTTTVREERTGPAATLGKYKVLEKKTTKNDLTPEVTSEGADKSP